MNNRNPISFFPAASKPQCERWLAEGLYKEILAFEMPAEELQYHPVFTIRTPKSRPDDKPKTEYWKWEKLPALGEMNPE